MKAIPALALLAASVPAFATQSRPTFTCSTPFQENKHSLVVHLADYDRANMGPSQEGAATMFFSAPGMPVDVIKGKYLAMKIPSAEGYSRWEISIYGGKIGQGTTIQDFHPGMGVRANFGPYGRERSFYNSPYRWSRGHLAPQYLGTTPTYISMGCQRA